jgi:hypothetical protein
MFFIKIASVESKICVLIEPPVLFPIVPTVKLLWEFDIIIPSAFFSKAINDKSIIVWFAFFELTSFIVICSIFSLVKFFNSSKV